MKSSFRLDSKFADLPVEKRREELIRRLREACSEVYRIVSDIDIDRLAHNLYEQSVMWNDAASWGDDEQFRHDRKQISSLCMIAEALSRALREAKVLDRLLQSANAVQSQPVETPEKSTNI